jgi:FlaA1/EpsC-like NDP-sugar epimerase
MGTKFLQRIIFAVLNEMGTKSLRWVIFTVLIALLPLAFIYLIGNYETLWKLISDKKADIVFMGVTFCAVGIGELIESATSNVTMPKIATYSLWGTSIIVIIWGALLYGGIALGKAETISIQHVYLIFGFSVVCSTGCIILSEFTEKKMREQLLEGNKKQLNEKLLESRNEDGDKMIQMMIQVFREHPNIPHELRGELILEVCKELNLPLRPAQMEQVFSQPAGNLKINN